jgi:hypothetical protein
VKPNINSVEGHPQPSNNKHPVDVVMVGAGSLWPYVILYGAKVKILRLHKYAHNAYNFNKFGYNMIR